MAYTIIKGVPIPPKDLRKVSLYPWDRMEVGDSFIVEAERRGRVREAIRKRHRQGAERYRTKVLDDGTMQIWRVEDERR